MLKLLLLLLLPYSIFASESSDLLQLTVSNVWLLLSTVLVFIMHLGFASLEAGLTQSKNTVNILFKNIFIICFGIISYAYIGFQIMYPGEFNGILGFSGFGLTLPKGHYNDHYTFMTDFIFQAMFCATAATICFWSSG